MSALHDNDNEFDDRTNNASSTNLTKYLNTSDFPHPTLNDIPGTKQEKLQFLTNYSEFWSNLKSNTE